MKQADCEAIWDLLLPDEQRVLTLILKDHRGMANAVHQPELAARAGTSVRRLREIAKRLVEEFGLGIGTSLPCGYFLIETAEEAEMVARHLRARGISNLIHAAAINKITRRQFADELNAEIGRLGLFKDDGHAPDGP
jgi:hypothetical protein